MIDPVQEAKNILAAYQIEEKDVAMPCVNMRLEKNSYWVKYREEFEWQVNSDFFTCDYKDKCGYCDVCKINDSLSERTFWDIKYE